MLTKFAEIYESTSNSHIRAEICRLIEWQLEQDCAAPTSTEIFLWRNGDKVRAVVSYKKRLGLGLVEAKNQFEEYVKVNNIQKVE